MAIVRGAGTEIIRAHCHEAVNSTARDLIIGVQHHIYTQGTGGSRSSPQSPSSAQAT